MAPYPMVLPLEFGIQELRELSCSPAYRMPCISLPSILCIHPLESWNESPLQVAQNGYWLQKKIENQKSKAVKLPAIEWFYAEIAGRINWNFQFESLRWPFSEATINYHFLWPFSVQTERARRRASERSVSKSAKKPHTSRCCSMAVNAWASLKEVLWGSKKRSKLEPKAANPPGPVVHKKQLPLSVDHSRINPEQGA